MTQLVLKAEGARPRTPRLRALGYRRRCRSRWLERKRERKEEKGEKEKRRRGEKEKRKKKERVVWRAARRGSRRASPLLSGGNC